MLDNFLNELEELLHSKPYSSVDIQPLVKQYTEGKTNDESVKIRLRISSIIEQLKKSDFIDVANDYNFLLVAMVYQQFSEDPIYVRGTIKFENDYKEKRKQPLQPITHNTINAGSNIGAIIQSSDLSGDFNLPINTPPTEANINANKKSNLLIDIWELISNNKLISSVISGIILAVVLYLIFGRPK